MVEEFISISWVSNIHVWGKLATVFSSLPSPPEHLKPDATRHFSPAPWKKLFKFSQKIKYCSDGYCFPTLVRPNAAAIYRRARSWSRERLAGALHCAGKVLLLSESFCWSTSRCKAHEPHSAHARFSLVRVCLFRKIMKKKRQYWDGINKEINHFAIQCEPNLKINNYFKSYQAPITNITFIQLIHV